MVAPPVAFLDFSHIQAPQGPDLVIFGSHDAFAPPELVRATIDSWNPLARLEMIDGADHFFRDLYAYDLVETVVPWLEAGVNP